MFTSRPVDMSFEIGGTLISTSLGFERRLPYDLEGEFGGIVEILFEEGFFLRVAVGHADAEDGGRDAVGVEEVRV